MDRIKLVALEGDNQRATLLKKVVEGTGDYELVLSNHPRKLLAQMDGRDKFKLVLTNTRVWNDDQDGLKFIKALHLKYQRYKAALPPIIVCSGQQDAQIIKLYAYHFSSLGLIYYVLIGNEELEGEGGKLLQTLESSLGKRLELEESAPDNKHEVIREKLHKLLKQTVSLPKLPDVALRVQNALDDPDISFEKLARIISNDLTLSANMIKLANSPAYGVSGQIATVEDACKQVGLNAIGNTVVATKVFDALEDVPADFDIHRLRRHSYAVATIARVAARRCRAISNKVERLQFSGTMFAAGLLHDIGKVLMAEYFREELEKIMERTYAGDCTLVEAEHEVIGVSHADAGLHAGIEWKFPVLLINVIGRHHWPLKTILSRLKTRQGHLSQRLIRIADAASYELGYGMLRSDSKPPVLDPAYFENTGLSKEQFDAMRSQIKDDIAYTFEALGKV